MTEEEHCQKLLLQILAAAPGGLTDEDCRAAWDEMHSFLVTEALLKLWRRNEVTTKWDAENKCLAFRTTNREGVAT